MMRDRALRLAHALREVAREYDEFPNSLICPVTGNSYNRDWFQNGICWAVRKYYYSQKLFMVNAYADVDVALCEIQEGFKQFRRLGEDYRDVGTSWEPRANMCLLMAEWLEEA